MIENCGYTNMFIFEYECASLHAHALKMDFFGHKKKKE